jgi:thioesterase domain-containing protein
VFKYPTIKQLAEFTENNSDQSHFVMEFGGSGDEAPFFFISGITRNALVFRGLAQLIGGDRLCYGLELPMPQDDEEPLKTLEELGSHCAEQIRNVQPHGPYNLAGYSFGGFLAYETARQLCHPDEPRPNVVLFDSRHRLPTKHGLAKRLKWGIRLLHKEKLKYLRYVLKEFGYSLGSKMGLKYHSPALIPIELMTGGIRPIMSSAFHYSYDPAPSPLNLLLFTVRDTEYSITSGNDLKRWNNYSDNEVMYHRIEADYHNQILGENHLESITEKIQDLINEE